MSRNAQDFVTPEARYAEHARDMSGVAGGAGGPVAMYPLYGLGQTAPVDPNVWYRRPMVVLPVGIVLGIGIGWGIWGWFMPRMRKSVRKNIQRGQED
jgi:hypothetical protein